MFVAFGIRNALRMHRIMLSSVACPAVQYFSTLPHNEMIFEKKKLYLTYNVFWFPLQFMSETFLILTRTERDIIINVR